MLVGERIIVKDLAEDLYDGQVLQKLFGEDQFISFRFKVRFVHFMPSTGCLVNYSCNEIQAFFSQPNVETTFFSYQKREELTRISRPENMKNSNNNFNNKSPLYDTIASHVFFFSNTFLKW